jgi:predicted permease
MERASLPVRIFDALLRLYPGRFREHFGREMRLAFIDLMRERPGALTVLGMYLQVLIDAPREHAYLARQDVTAAVRAMRRHRVIAVTAVVVVVLGIGATTTVFTLVDGLLLRPLPYPDQQRLVYVEEEAPGMGLRGAIAYPNYLEFYAHNRSLQDLAMFGSGVGTLRGDGDAETVPVASGTEALLRVLGMTPLFGRSFTVEDTRPGAPPVVLLSEDLWRRRYGGDPAIIGRTIGVGTPPAQVIGVMPRGFHFPSNAELWTPLRLDLGHNTRSDHALEGIGRLRAGISLEQAREDLRGIMAQINRDHPTETYGQTVNVLPYRARDTRQVRPLLLTLLGAVAFVLLIACTNIINLLLAKASEQTREIALRSALGASRGRLVRQSLTEALLLAAPGAVVGVLLSAVSVPAVLAMVREQIPGWSRFAPDVRVVGFVAALIVITTVLAGVVPGAVGGRLRLVEALKASARSHTGRGRVRLRAALVVAEVAMSLVLLVGGGLMIQTFRRLEGMNPGFAIHELVTFETGAPMNRYPVGGRQAAELVRRLREALAAVPGVISVAGTSTTPLLNRWGRSFTAEGGPALGLKEAPLINHAVVTPGYFRTLGIPIVAGRDFEETDGSGPLVTIVDEGIASRYWPHESAVGKRVRYGPPEQKEPWHTIVGVVGVARNQGLREVGRNSVYLPQGERQVPNLAYLVRTAPGLVVPAQSLRDRVRSVDRDIALGRVLTLDAVVSQAVWKERLLMVLLTGLGVLALILAMVGLYGVVAYTVARRTQEIGIRMALGASPLAIQRLVVAQSARLVGAGLAAGTVAALMLTRLLRSMLYEVSPHDAHTFVAVAALLMAFALLASYLPARRATRVDPSHALRVD